ncbi:putative primosomal protein [Actinoplanes missouriensis 431]|uniref:Probable replication restart protein PriA n=1 Tax=Actinoplanes missouriensis (strain ATCC 14538 / DSM 43046 / CBS 188.64 / JCM 3121 / NBRC 102363 / NCIMB 12654 / NRRL B-3342 / UNCC 431) TaxID=512565 RepID=I0HEI8_ACTM4|nr:primosomal protein N' [Actinoplanes missouriensis]BAL91425.1 putative primosomal protein [Actinoplanes missouriensis 431]
MGTKGARSEREPAERLPVARVCVDVSLPHLDRPFDYLVPADSDEAAQPGVRVKVRFAGQLVSGFLLERVESSEHGGKLAYLERVVSPERVLDPEIARLAEAVAKRYAGNLADVLRLAVPPRHARVEAAAQPAPVSPTDEGAQTGREAQDHGEPPPGSEAQGGGEPLGDGEVGSESESRAGAEVHSGDGVRAGAEVHSGDGARAGDEVLAGGEVLAGDEVLAGGEVRVAGDGTAGPAAVEGIGAPAAGGWDSYAAGTGFLRALADGRAARAVWSALPGEDWAARIAEAAGAAVRGGKGVVIVVADARDLERVDAALGAVLGAGRHVALNAALGPAERYRRFLAASRHRVPVVAGTRAAMWAPVHDLGLVVIWDDGDDVLAEPRAPYPHAREVLLTRAQLAGCAVLVGGFARTGEAQLLLETGWAKEIVADRVVLRRRSPAIAPTGDDPQLARDPGAVSARLPSLAWQTARQALKDDAPVLVQVPRRGYLPAVACAECRTPARCPHCSGPLGLTGARDVPVCHWCGRASAAYECPACGERRLRASVTGARRTAEELGRAFPGVPVRTSGRDEVLVTVPAEASLVVSTPGAEPVAEGGGYGAVLLLDTWALLSRSDLRAAEETMRRWLNAAALARPAPAGGKVVVVADGSLAPVQALLRWDPGWFAARELAERRELGFPPAARMASVTGTAPAVADLLAHAKLPDGAEVLGPVPADGEQERMLLRVSRSRAGELARALHEAAAMRSARKAAQPVRIQVDPSDLF